MKKVKLLLVVPLAVYIVSTGITRDLLTKRV